MIAPTGSRDQYSVTALHSSPLIFLITVNYKHDSAVVDVRTLIPTTGVAIVSYECALVLYSSDS